MRGTQPHPPPPATTRTHRRGASSPQSLREPEPGCGSGAPTQKKQTIRGTLPGRAPSAWISTFFLYEVGGCTPGGPALPAPELRLSPETAPMPCAPLKAPNPPPTAKRGEGRGGQPGLPRCPSPPRHSCDTAPTPSHFLHIGVIEALKRHVLPCRGQWGTPPPLLLSGAPPPTSSGMAWAFLRRKGLQWTCVEVAQAARGFHGSCLPHTTLFGDPGGPANVYCASPNGICTSPPLGDSRGQGASTQL